MLEKVAKRVKKGITDEGWNETKLKDAHALRKDIEVLLSSKSKLAKTKIGQGILKAYKEGVNSAERDAGKPQTIMKDLNVPLSIQNVLLANYNLIDDGNSKILRNVDDAYREVMAETATGLLSGVDTRITASQKMMDKLAARGITSFTDKAGRQWQMDSYTEMAMRTATAHAAIEGHIQTQESFGMDLMKVSSIGTTCPICAKWQGVVLSISGKTPGYHTVDEARADGLFHPNCKHTITMFDPEIDGEGQKEPNSEAVIEKATARYGLIQQQRHNERNIRYWKRREAASIDPKAKDKARQKVKAWQYKNLIHCEKNNLRRNYAREGIRGVKLTSPDMLIGGHLKEYEEVYKKVVGASPKSTMLKINLQLFGHTNVSQAQYVKWLKEEITSLDGLDVEKAFMKDPDIKSVTPTSMYKKYISDTPTEDYAKVATAAKGTNEYKTGYAKWLKQQIEEIGTTYQVKPVDPILTADELKAELKQHSLTETYKKYINPDPSPTFKAVGGEAATGMKYAQWLKAEVQKLTDPQYAAQFKQKTLTTFDNKKINIIQDKTKALADQVAKQQNTQKVSQLEAEVSSLESSASNLKSKVDWIVDHKVSYSGIWASGSKDIDDYEDLKNSGSIEAKKNYFKQKLIDDPNDTYSQNKLNALNNFEKEGEQYLSLKSQLDAQKAELKAKQDELDKIKPVAPKAAAPQPVGKLTPEKAREIAKQWASELANQDTSAGKAEIRKRDALTRKYIASSTGIDESFMRYGRGGTISQISWRDSTNDAQKGWYQVYEYTKSSGKFNWPARGKDRGNLAETYAEEAHRKGEGLTEMKYYKKYGKYLDKIINEGPKYGYDVTLKRKAGTEALADFLGLDPSWFNQNEINQKIAEVNKNPGSYVGKDKGYVSMSTSKQGSWSGNVGFIMRATDGSRILRANEISHYGNEDETLVGRNVKQKCMCILQPGDDGFDDVCKSAGWSDYTKPSYIIVTESIPDKP